MFCPEEAERWCGAAAGLSQHLETGTFPRNPWHFRGEHLEKLLLLNRSCPVQFLCTVLMICKGSSCCHGSMQRALCPSAWKTHAAAVIVTAAAGFFQVSGKTHF